MYTLTLSIHHKNNKPCCVTKTHDACVINTHDASVIKTHDAGVIKTHGACVIKTHDAGVIKDREATEMVRYTDTYIHTYISFIISAFVNKVTNYKIYFKIVIFLPAFERQPTDHPSHGTPAHYLQLIYSKYSKAHRWDIQLKCCYILIFYISIYGLIYKHDK